MVLHAIPDRLRSAPATAGILAPRGNDVTNPVNTGIYGGNLFGLERGEVRLASLYLITFLRFTVPIARPLSCKIGLFL
jgi:hypothetical protein